MSHGTDHHLEEAHHAEHASHDEFTKRVAMTMAIIAACLAVVTLQSHRAHNQTLQKLQEASMRRTEAASRWAQYQSKSVRRAVLEAGTKMLPVTARADKEEESKKVEAAFQAEVTRYRTPEGEEEDPKKLEMASLIALAEKLDEKANKLNEDSEQIHHTADRFDMGELALSFALVLCSVAVLTKRPLYWLLGIATGVVGFIVAVWAYVLFVML